MGKEAEAVDTEDTTTTITTISVTTKVTAEITTNHHKTTMVEILEETTIFKLNLHHPSNNNMEVSSMRMPHLNNRITEVIHNKVILLHHRLTTTVNHNKMVMVLHSRADSE